MNKEAKARFRAFILAPLIAIPYLVICRAATIVLNSESPLEIITSIPVYLFIYMLLFGGWGVVAIGWLIFRPLGSIPSWRFVIVGALVSSLATAISTSYTYSFWSTVVVYNVIMTVAGLRFQSMLRRAVETTTGELQSKAVDPQR